MIDYTKWDEYYDGGFADEEPINNFNEEYDERSELEKLEYGGQKTNVTAKLIMQETGTTAISEKFLYRNGVVIILLDYSKGIFDKWKNGRILHCLGDRTYTTQQNTNGLSIIDRTLFNADSIDKIIVRAFWKDETKKYRLVNGLLVLSKEKPYTIEENGKYRWVFPLSLMSKYNFQMPEKYSYFLDIKSVKEAALINADKEDGVRLTTLNKLARFSSSKNDIHYKRTPQKKIKYTSVQEKIERSSKIAENALILADFKCEINNDHFTFIRKNQNVPYTEAHHLVPLAYSDLFNYSLDVEENIISLCSTCHNQIHYGKDSESLIKKLYANRKELLKEAGIVLSEQELLEMYNNS